MSSSQSDTQEALDLTLGLSAKLIRERDDLRVQLRASEAEVARLTRELEEQDLRRHELCNLLELDANSPWATVVADVKVELLEKEKADD